MCEDISKSPGAREIGGRDGLLKKEAKKTTSKACDVLAAQYVGSGPYE